MTTDKRERLEGLFKPCGVNPYTMELIDSSGNRVYEKDRFTRHIMPKPPKSTEIREPLTTKPTKRPCGHSYFVHLERCPQCGARILRGKIEKS